jgi:hypothetical protein
MGHISGRYAIVGIGETKERRDGNRSGHGQHGRVRARAPFPIRRRRTPARNQTAAMDQRCNVMPGDRRPSSLFAWLRFG